MIIFYLLLFFFSLAEQQFLHAKEYTEIKTDSFSYAAKNQEQKISKRKKNTYAEWTKFCSLEFRGAYFLPTSSAFQTAYSGGALWGLEADFRLNKSLYTWLSVNFFREKGTPLIGTGSMNLTMLPLNLGLKWIWTSHKVQPYVGVGIEAIYANEQSNNSLALRNRSSWGCGGIFKTGLLCYFTAHFFLDFYTDYSLRPLHLRHLSSSTPQLELIHFADLSGFSFGSALGYGF